MPETSASTVTMRVVRDARVVTACIVISLLRYDAPTACVAFLGNTHASTSFPIDVLVPYRDCLRC